MRYWAVSAILLSAAGCAMHPQSPVRVDRSYQIRLTDSPNVSQVRVMETTGDWIRLQYHENSPRVDPGLDDVWVNASHIVWLAPYE